jgi:myo-inositol 2-dehydrogenase/D-chiro-inositol 1-dehydrogenase
MTLPTKPSTPLRDRVSRRDFFSRFSAAASYAVTGAVTAPLLLESELSAASGNNPIRLGILGLGSRGLQLVDASLKIPSLNIACVYDPEPSTIERVNARIQRAGRPLPRLSASDLALIQADDIDALLISTPSDLHASQIQAAIDSGKHILTEKPVALAHDDLANLLPKLETLDHQVFMVGFTRRFHPARTALIQWLNIDHPLGGLIDIQVSWTHPQGPPRGRGDWMLNPARSGDWLTEHGDHIFDLIMDLRNDLPEVTSARRIGSIGHSSKYWSVALKWEDGVVAQIRDSMLPGSNFASPGLSFLAQYEKGLVDLISGRVSAVSGVSVPVIFPKDFDTTSAMLSTFVDRIKAVKNQELNRFANMQECNRTSAIHELRSKIVENL